MLVTTFQHNIDRLHIQGHRWGNEALHGVLDLGTTSWPSPIGVAASYNKSLFFALGALTSTEGYDHQTFWTPNIK